MESRTMSRLFIALKIPDLILDQLIDIRDELYADGEAIRWEPKDKLHVTLKFLGETENCLEVGEKLSKVLHNVKEFKCKLDTFGLFYRYGNPSILWASIAHNDKLISLGKQIDIAMHNIGFDIENRKFKPHITILRNKRKNNSYLLDRFKGYDLSRLEFTGKSIELIKSDLKPTGSVYTTIKNFELIKKEE